MWHWASVTWPDSRSPDTEPGHVTGELVTWNFFWNFSVTPYCMDKKVTWSSKYFITWLKMYMVMWLFRLSQGTILLQNIAAVLSQKPYRVWLYHTSGHITVHSHHMVLQLVTWPPFVTFWSHYFCKVYMDSCIFGSEITWADKKINIGNFLFIQLF